MEERNKERNGEKSERRSKLVLDLVFCTKAVP